jgi:transcriptional regulator with XRE-family HTH domain
MPFERVRPEPPTMFGRAIMQKRRKENLSQVEAGERLGISMAQISYYETGSRPPTLSKFVRIIDWLGTRPSTAYEMMRELGEADAHS